MGRVDQSNAYSGALDKHFLLMSQFYIILQGSMPVNRFFQVFSRVFAVFSPGLRRLQIKLKPRKPRKCAIFLSIFLIFMLHVCAITEPGGVILRD